MLKTTPRAYQDAIFQTAKNANTLVVLPTGTGKTLIALLLAIERKKLFPLSKILFLAPTKPLVEQHFETFTSQLPELFADLQIFTGSVSPENRKKIFQTAEIIFSTPQCIANDIENHLYDLKEVSLLIIDEAHRCLKNYDYTKVVSTYKSQSLFPRILGLTASPGHDPKNIKEICEHLDIKSIELRTRDSEDVKPYLQELEFTRVDVPFPPEFMEIQLLLKKILDSCAEKLRNRKLLFLPANKFTLLKLQSSLARQASSRNFNALIGMSLTAQALKVSHALELLETQTLSGVYEYFQNLLKQAAEKKSKAVQNLVQTSEFIKSHALLTELISRKVEHPKVETAYEIIKSEFELNPKTKIIVFTQFRETASSIVKRLSQLSIIHPSIFVGQAKKGETGFSQKEQKAILDKFRGGEINVLVATSIGEEGLDIAEVGMVIFYEPVPSAIRRIQRAGRTARLSPGKLIILITENTRDKSNHYASYAREKKMHREIANVQNELRNQNKNPTLDKFK